MRNIVRRIILSIMVVSMVVSAFPGLEVKAASKKSKVLKAYASYLKKSGNEEFTVADLNGDGIPELFTDSTISDIPIIYKNNKTARLSELDWAWGLVYYPNRNYLMAERVGAFDDTTQYARLTKRGDLIWLASRVGDVQFGDERTVKYEYYVNGKKATKKKYNAYVKSLEKGAKELKLEFHKNTSANRKKYLR